MAGRPAVDVDRAAIILAEAEVYSVRLAAERAGVHRNTVSNYRKLLEHDDALVQKVAAEKKRLLAEWEAGAIRLQVKLQAELESRLEQAEFRDLVGSYKINGELLVAKGALSGGQPQSDNQGAEAAAPQSGKRRDGKPVH